MFRSCRVAIVTAIAGLLFAQNAFGLAMETRKMPAKSAEAKQNPSAQPSPAPEKELEQKIKALQEQIDQLRKQQDALIKEREKQAQEAEKAKRRFAKVEIRGKLLKTPPISDFAFPDNTNIWHIAVNGLVLRVEFTTGEQRSLAEKYTDQEVIITGSLVRGEKFVRGKHESPIETESIIQVQAESLKLAPSPEGKGEENKPGRAEKPDFR